MSERLIEQSRHDSISDHSCQVRMREIACLDRPVFLVAVLLDIPDLLAPGASKVEQRAVRACAAHAETLKRRYGERVVAVRDWP